MINQLTAEQIVIYKLVKRENSKYHLHFGEDGSYTVKLGLDGPIHRLDGPAVVSADGTEDWYQDGKLHRDPDPETGEELPAVIRPNGGKYWYKHGLLHRLDGPAVVEPEQHEIWIKDGVWQKETRLNQCFPYYGPAIG